MRSTRHIITTSVTTIGGFLPLLVSSIFFKPLAWAMAGGVFGATIIALFYIPSLYAIKEKLLNLGFLLWRFGSLSIKRPESS